MYQKNYQERCEFYYFDLWLQTYVISQSHTCSAAHCMLKLYCQLYILAVLKHLVQMSVQCYK